MERNICGTCGRGKGIRFGTRMQNWGHRQGAKAAGWAGRVEGRMSQSITEPLILDLVAWVAKQPRPYGEVINAWRTNCPRLTVWEDAVERGLVACVRQEGELVVEATARGQAALGSRR